MRSVEPITISDKTYAAAKARDEARKYNLANRARLLSLGVTFKNRSK